METAQSNKVLLLLCAGLLLLIFMDLQAKRHARLLTEASGGRIEERGRELERQIDPILRPVRRSAAEAFGIAQGQDPKPADHSRGGAADRERPSREPRGEQAIRLYFLRFHGGRPKTVAVERRLPLPIRPQDLLAQLKRGPLASERGLLSAVESVQFGGVQVENGTATVEVSPHIGRNGARLVRARLDQVALTLKQLPEIKRVRLSIDGELLDIVAGVPVEPPRRPTQ